MPDLVLLDIGLPGEDGFALARWLREKSGRICIIMVTAAGETVDRIVGLETGADDYIPKPFEPRELLARIKSVLRRTGGRRRADRRAAGAHGPARARPREARPDRGRRQRGDAVGQRVRPAEGVRRESRTGRSTRDWMLETIGHREMEAFDRAIDLRISRIRRKVEVDPAHPDGDPHRARRRLHVRAAEGLRGEQGEHTAGGHGT